MTSDKKDEENKLNVDNESISNNNNDNNINNLFNNNNVNNEEQQDKSKINKKKRGRPRKSNNGSDLSNNNNMNDNVTSVDDSLFSDNNEINLIHDKKQQHSCTKCDDCFTKKSDLKRHLITDHNEEDNTVEK